MWQDKAACNSLGGDRADAVFFPELKTDRQKPPVKQLPGYDAAREWCGSCSVVNECLAAELEVEKDKSWLNRFGMRGGLDPAERARLAAQRRSNTEAQRRALHDQGFTPQEIAEKTGVRYHIVYSWAKYNGLMEVGKS